MYLSSVMFYFALLWLVYCRVFDQTSARIALHVRGNTGVLRKFPPVPFYDHSMTSEGPTQEPFTSAGESTAATRCGCCGVFMVPLAAIGGVIDQISRKLARLGRRK